MKTDEAKFILKSYGKLGKKVYAWDVPVDLEIINKKNKYRAIIGIGRWKNTKELFVAVSQGDEIIFFKKSVWLQIARDIKKLRNKI